VSRIDAGTADTPTPAATSMMLVRAKLEASGVDATYFLLESVWHDATTPDAAKFAPVLRSFMERISTS
jgi:hypothetical protein